MNAYLTRVIQQLEQIEREEVFPAQLAADILADTLCEIAIDLPAEQQSQMPNDPAFKPSQKLLHFRLPLFPLYPISQDG